MPDETFRPPALTSALVDPGVPEDARDSGGGGTATSIADLVGEPDDDGAPRRGRRGRIVGWTITALLAVVVVATALLALDALRARDALAQAVPLVEQTQETLAQDPSSAVDLAELQDLTATARTSTDGPLWWLAARLPGIGADAGAVSVSADALDVVTHDVLPPLLEARDGVDLAALRPVDGRIDLAPIEAAAPAVADAAAALESPLAAVTALDPTELRDVVAGPVEALQDGLVTLDRQVTAAETVTTVLPPLLGSDGERRYLVMFLTNAELRSTGGIPGALAVLTADDGRVELVEQASSADVGPFTDPVPALTPEEEAIWSSRPAQYLQDSTMLPDFPRAATLAATMWEQSGRGAVDGVIATDPVALSYFLEATGPVAIPGGQIEASTAVDLLLSGAYAMFEEPAQQDAFFASVSSAVFGAALGGAADPGLLGDAVARAAEERRLTVWSADAALQGDLEDLGIAGSLAAAPETAGVFLADGTGGKLDAYLDADVVADSVTCTNGDAVTPVTVTLTSSVPADASSLPAYVLGSAAGGALEPGVIRTNVAIYSAADGTIGTLTRDGVVIGGDLYDDGAGRQVTTVTVDLVPGQATTITAELTAPAGRGAGLWTTPTARQGGNPGAPSCG